MKKRILLISLLTISLLIVGCNNNKEQNNNNNTPANTNKEEVIRINEDTRLSLKTQKEVSESERKNIQIDSFETGVFDIYLEKEEGTIEIEIFDGKGRNVIILDDRSIELEDKEEQVKIEDGNGEYTIEITTENFKGEYDISWKVEENNLYETYESELGYMIKYNSKKFECIKEDKSDKFILVKNEENESNENIFLKVTMYEKKEAESIKNTLLTDDKRIGDCYIGIDQMQGKYVLEDENNNLNRKFCVDLEDGRLLVVEENYVDSHEEDYETKLNIILDSIVIK